MRAGNSDQSDSRNYIAIVSVTNQRFQFFIHGVNELLTNQNRKESRGFPVLFKISHIKAEKAEKPLYHINEM